MKLKYYKNLDGIRAIAALMIIAFHFFQNLEPNSFGLSFLKKISVFGQTGVTLFFVLSGFLITRILLQTKFKEGFFKSFYMRRSLRIFPLYYLFLFMFYFIIPVFTGGEFVPFDQQAFYYLYLQNFATTFHWESSGPGHFWSLAVEEHFYLFWPLIVFFTDIKKLKSVIWGIVIAAFILRMIMVNQNYEVFYFTFTRFDSLAIGALLALLEIKQKFKPQNTKWFIALLAAIFIPTIIIWVFLTGIGTKWVQVIKFDLLAFTYFALIGSLLCLREKNIINRLLKTEFFQYSGKISYGLYVFHPLVFSFSHRYVITNNWIADLLIGIILSYGLSALSYHLFEFQFLKLKRFFTYEKKSITEFAINK